MKTYCRLWDYIRSTKKEQQQNAENKLLEGQYTDTPTYTVQHLPNMKPFLQVNGKFATFFEARINNLVKTENNHQNM